MTVLAIIVAMVATTVTGLMPRPRRHTVVAQQQMQMQMQQQTADVVVPPLATEPPLKVLLMVEPTPFNYVSGYANRFKEMLKFLKQAGDDVHVLTADKDPQPPTEYLNYPISTNRGFEWPLYKHVTLSFDFSMKTKQIIEDFKPDLIHVSSPSCVMWPAIIWARLYDLPLVISYHTDFVKYSKTYGGWPGAGWTAYHVVRLFHNRADLTLCTSPQVRTHTHTHTHTHASVPAFPRVDSLSTTNHDCSCGTIWRRGPASVAWTCGKRESTPR